MDLESLTDNELTLKEVIIIIIIIIILEYL